MEGHRAVGGRVPSTVGVQIVSELRFYMVVPLSASCSGKGLAAHLEVPLPYLLCRVNTRFQ